MYALLRSYNNPQTYDLINKLIDTGLFNKIIVVVNVKKDRIKTYDTLKNAFENNVVLPVSITEWGWSKALNTGIKKTLNLADSCDQVLVISNEVDIKYEEIIELKKASEKHMASCAYSLFKGRREESYLVPRNTCSLWNMSIFGSIGFFNEELDKIQGMEDYEITLRAFQKKHFLPYVGPKNVKLQRKNYSDFKEKTENEIKTMLQIEQQFPVSVVKTVRDHLFSQNQYNT